MPSGATKLVPVSHESSCMNLRSALFGNVVTMRGPHVGLEGYLTRYSGLQPS
jgi:hypothetical protein